MHIDGHYFQLKNLSCGELWLKPCFVMIIVLKYLINQYIS
jgi:hypothetical protein